MFGLILSFVQKYINSNIYDMDISVDDVKSTDMLPLAFPEVNDYLVSIDDEILQFCEERSAEDSDSPCLAEDSIERILMNQQPMTLW